MGKLVDSMFSLFGLQPSSDRVILSHNEAQQTEGSLPQALKQTQPARAGDPDSTAKDRPAEVNAVASTPMSATAIASATKEADAIVQQLQREQESATMAKSNEDCLSCKLIAGATMAGATGFALYTAFRRKQTYDGRSLLIFRIQCLLLASVCATLGVARMLDLSLFEERVGKEITYTNLLKEDTSKLLRSIGLKTPDLLQPKYIEQTQIMDDK